MQAIYYKRMLGIGDIEFTMQSSSLKILSICSYEQESLLSHVPFTYSDIKRYPTLLLDSVSMQRCAIWNSNDLTARGEASFGLEIVP